MSTKAIRLTATALAAAAFVFLPAAAGYAGTPLSAAKPAPQSGSFELTVTDAMAETLSQVTLTCPPDGGSHPRAAEACDQLNAHSGDISGIVAQNGMCTMEYEPVTVRATGSWQGHEESYSARFSNRCVAVKETGGVVFDF